MVSSQTRVSVLSGPQPNSLTAQLNEILINIHKTFMEQTIPSEASYSKESPPPFYEGGRFIAGFTTAPPPNGRYSQPRLPVHFLNIPFNIILPLSTRSSKRFP